MKIEITWNRPDGTKHMVGFQTQPNDPNADDEEMQIHKSVAGAQAYFNQKFGVAPPVNQLSVQTFSVSFKFLSLDDPRYKREMGNSFLKVGQLVGWELPSKAETYTGLIVVGEKAVPQGFQSMADFTLDIPATPIPMERAQQIAQTVMREFQQRGTIQLTTPGKA